MKARVRLADPARDRPRPGVLWATGAGALTAGLALSAALAPPTSTSPAGATDADEFDLAESDIDAGRPTLAASATTTPTPAKHASASKLEGREARDAVDASRPLGEAGVDAASTGVDAGTDAALARATLDAGSDAGAANVLDAGRDPSSDQPIMSLAAPTATVPVPSAAPLPSAANIVAASPAAAAAPPATAASDTPHPAQSAPAIADVRAREAAARAAQNEVEPGVVAYVHCDGVERNPGPYPCPREPQLERAVWNALASLSQCEEQPGHGAGEVRLDFRRGRRVKVTIRSRSRQAPGLDAAAVKRCVGADLQSIRSRLRPRRMIVSFRFRLR